MNAGLFTKEFRETRVQTALFGVALGGAMGLLTFILPKIQSGMSEVFESMPFVKTIMQGLLGTSIGDRLSAEMMQSILWVHPVVLTLVWAHEIVFCTRVPAGEIDRGTVDILLSLPVSRRAIYWTETVGWLVSGLVVLSCGVLGHIVMRSQLPVETRPDAATVLVIMCNFYCVYFAVGAGALLVSAMSDRRGRAAGVVFGLVLASFLLNFLAQFWDVAERLSFLSVSHYYRPAELIQSGETPWRNMGVLLSVGAVFWIAGGEIFARRNVATV